MLQPSPPQAADLAARYLDLVERCLKNEIHGESRLETFLQRAVLRARHPRQTAGGGYAWPARAQTMLSGARLRHLRVLTEATLRDGVPGGYLEAGVWRGGACILMRAVLAAYGVTTRRVFLPGLFEQTLPTLAGERFALIHLDGDMYASILDALTCLYDRLSPGGYAVVDDYGVLPACRRAVHDFLDSRALAPEILPVDAKAVWWRKA